SRTRMLSGVAENVDEQIRRAIGNKMLLGEIGGGGNKYGNLHHAFDAIEVAKSSLRLCEDIDCTGTSRRLSLRNRQPASQLAGEDQLAIFKRKLAGSQKQVAALREGNIICGGGGSFRQGDAKIGKAAVDCVGHSSVSLVGNEFI